MARTLYVCSVRACVLGNAFMGRSLWSWSGADQNLRFNYPDLTLSIPRRRHRTLDTFSFHCLTSCGHRCTWRHGDGTRSSWRFDGGPCQRHPSCSNRRGLCTRFAFSIITRSLVIKVFHTFGLTGSTRGELCDGASGTDRGTCMEATCFSIPS
jgi:hypothetical protein